MSSDKEQIEAHGGAAKVASLLGYTVQRVQNWKDRGIPAAVKLAHPDLFPLPKPALTWKGRRSDKKKQKSS